MIEGVEVVGGEHASLVVGVRVGGRHVAGVFGVVRHVAVVDGGCEDTYIRHSHVQRWPKAVHTCCGQLCEPKITFFILLYTTTSRSEMTSDHNMLCTSTIRSSIHNHTHVVGWRERCWSRYLKIYKRYTFTIFH